MSCINTHTKLAGLRACMRNSVQAYQRVDELVNAGADGGFGPRPRHPRLPGGTKPSVKENPLNAWYVTCHVEAQRPKGPLVGKTLAVKDTIAVAGIPIMNGSRALEGWTPDFEATCVTRALDAGATVVGKAVAEDLCCSGSSFATAHGPVRNPRAPTHAAGGSSSGCGALLGAGAVDLALGTDQGVRLKWAGVLVCVCADVSSTFIRRSALLLSHPQPHHTPHCASQGSIRIPASWCGCVGLKPTFGLVPYTGVASHEPSLDHVGPMARTVEDCARLLEVRAATAPSPIPWSLVHPPPTHSCAPSPAQAIAGRDAEGMDPRQQPADCPTAAPRYSELATGDVTGLRIGLLTEGMEG